MEDSPEYGPLPPVVEAEPDEFEEVIRPPGRQSPGLRVRVRSLWASREDAAEQSAQNKPRFGYPEQWKQRAGWVLLLLAVAMPSAWFGAWFTHRSTPVLVSAGNVQTDHGAEAFAMQFAVDFLTYDESHRDDYENRMSRYIAQGVDPDVGWDGHGKQTAFQPVFVRSDSSPGGVRIYTVAAWTSANRWLTLAIPVASVGDSYAVTGLPMPVPGSQRADWSAPRPLTKETDVTFTSARLDDMAAFFRAYGASSPDLLFEQTVDAQITGLNGAYTDPKVDKLTLYDGGAVRDGEATVEWKDAKTGAIRATNYRLQLKQVNGKWLVSRLGLVTTPGGNS